MGSGLAVTAVVPTHNRLELLLRTLASVRAQTGVTTTAVVVDDGGSDGTSEELRARALPDVRVVRHEVSRGVSAARNSGLAAVRTPYVAFVDDDDLWAPDKTARQLAALAATPLATWSCVGAVHVDGELSVRGGTRVPPAGDISAGLLRGNVVPGGGSGLLVETAQARAVGGFDEEISILADWDFALRLSLAAPPATVDAPLVGYYVHADSMFHDPRGLLRELDHLEAAYRRSWRADLRPDRAYWCRETVTMARALGDVDTAAEILRDHYGPRAVSRARPAYPEADRRAWYQAMVRAAVELGEPRVALTLLRRATTRQVATAGLRAVLRRGVRGTARSARADGAPSLRDDDFEWLAAHRGAPAGTRQGS